MAGQNWTASCGLIRAMWGALRRWRCSTSMPNWSLPALRPSSGTRASRRICARVARAVSAPAAGAVGGRLAGGWVDAGQQVGPGGGQVEHDVLVDLAGVEAFADRLGGPQAELGVPQRAVGVGVPRVGQGREVPEHVQ